MNYRHAYHAGNFADVMKHLCVALILDRMMEKDAPLFALDAHGGIGLYDLQGIEAQKTGEWADGIGRFESASAYTDDFSLYYNALKGDLAQGRYPGSPLQMARMLRPQDRLIANELHPEDFETLRQTMRGFKGAKITHLDAYETIRAHIPPQEKRGLILIDPPFEKRDEFEILCRQMGEWRRRFATGVFALWYPIKAHLPTDAMKEAAREAGFPRTWCVETLMHPRGTLERFNGSGLLIFNTPYQVPERMEALLPLLTTHMGLHAAETRWITSA